jgi:hypothetical protein
MAGGTLLLFAIGVNKFLAANVKQVDVLSGFQ